LNESSLPLTARLRAGESPELLKLAARGLLPVEPDELIPVQVALARGDDPELAAEASSSLRQLSSRLAAAYLESAAGPEELAYFALEIGHPRLVEAVLRRRDAPRPLLVALAGTLTSELQEVLLLRQDAVVEEPAILDALEHNPRLSNYTRRRIGEFREHLLPRRRRAARPEAEEEQEAPEEATEEEVRAAVAAAKAARAAGVELIEHEEALGLAESELRALPVSVRLRLARGAPRVLRGIMLRDPNPQVAIHVLRTNALSDAEVEQIAQNRTIDEEVLDFIVNSRGWIRKYPILRALVGNPRTPIAAAVRLVPRLSVRDLRQIWRDRNASQAVRDTAGRLYRIKRM
jgi:hypothetical protein